MFPKKKIKKKTTIDKLRGWQKTQRNGTLKWKKNSSKKSTENAIKHRKKQQRKMSQRLSKGRIFRANVRARDNNTCQLCLKKYTDEEVKQFKLQVHHVKGRGVWQYDERYAICLCGCFTYKECHKVVHSNQKKWRPILLEILDEIYKGDG